MKTLFLIFCYLNLCYCVPCCLAVEAQSSKVQSGEAVSGYPLDILAYANMPAAGLARYAVGSFVAEIDTACASSAPDADIEIEVGSDICNCCGWFDWA
jgi:hypothetical protein